MEAFQERGDRGGAELNQITIAVCETARVGLDWGDGDYARTAALLAPAAEVLVDAAGVVAGDRVLDVACGTGNAALIAAARGAAVTGVDESARLLELAAERARAAGAEARFLTGRAEALPVEDAAFDVVLSSFGVIFAEEPARAAGEMVRAARPGGVIALTSWRPEGPIRVASELMRQAFPEPSEPFARWGDPDWVAQILIAAGAGEVRVEDAAIAFRDASPEAWLAEQVEHHPAWRQARRALGPEAWAPVHEGMIAALVESNEDPGAFLTTSRYLVVRAPVLTRPRGAGAPP
jgi:ubiquinone/menaquinone biosynthesis C-methylase UbiE